MRALDALARSLLKRARVPESQVWGIGCSGYCGVRHFSDESIWKAEFTLNGINNSNPVYSIGSWSRVPNGVAEQVALFSDLGYESDGSDTYQNPWVLTAEHEVWFWNGSSFTNARPPEPIIALTDHNALGASGQVYAWIID